MPIDDDDFIGQFHQIQPNIAKKLAGGAHGRPLVPPRAPLKDWIPFAFSVAGEAGDVKPVERRVYRSLFRGEDFFATDTSARPGSGTIVVSAHVGMQVQPIVGAPTWMFSEWVPYAEQLRLRALAPLVGTPAEDAEAREAARALRRIDAVTKMKFSTAYGGIPIMFLVKFVVACEWQAVLWGWAE